MKILKKKLLLIDKISLMAIIICLFVIICFIFYNSLYPLFNLRIKEANNSGQVFNNETMKLNVNTASEDELISLNGIGEKIAKEIIVYRNINGDFKTIDELIDINGIGKKTLEEIKKYLTAE